jgi:hypothetical protein
MKLKLLIAAFTVLLTTGACSIQFPLADNTPSLFSNSNSSSDESTSNMRLQSNEPDNQNPVKGNNPDSPN